MLQHAATRCNTLQHAATRCNTLLQHRESLSEQERSSVRDELGRLQPPADSELDDDDAQKAKKNKVCCSALQCVAECCSVL